MLVQPFLENAVAHGISQLKGVLGEINVNIYVLSNYLHIIIEDNGIGRERAQEIKSQQITKYESKGTKLTERRLALYQIECRIIDKKDSKNKALGTIIELKITINKPQTTKS
jgi:sensor histidine kinase YesM